MIGEHRAALEYDWRNRFHLPLSSAGRSMSWGEARRLLVLLAGDTSSQFCASVNGWASPIGREDMVLRDIFDLQHRSKAKKAPQPYPRPWHQQPKKIGGASMSIDQYEAIKRAAAEN